MNNANILLTALEDFFEEDMDLAEKAGYELTVGTNDKGTALYVDLDTEDENMPKISVYPRSKQEGQWDFSVDIEFPDLDLEHFPGKAATLVESWVKAMEIADDISSIRFVLDEWV